LLKRKEAHFVNVLIVGKGFASVILLLCASQMETQEK
jgi:hypothetical protein